MKDFVSCSIYQLELNHRDAKISEKVCEFLKEKHS